MGEESNNSNKSNEVLNLAFFVLTILSLSYTDYAVYEKDHKECYINYLWSLIGTYAFIASSFIYMICRLGVRMENESVLQQNMGFAIIVFVLSVVNLYVFMGIVWTFDSHHSLMFYPEFREWSIHLGHGVKHVTFYRIAECLVKIHSVILMLLLLLSPFILCCVWGAYNESKADNNSPLANDMLGTTNDQLSSKL